MRRILYFLFILVISVFCLYSCTTKSSEDKQKSAKKEEQGISHTQKKEIIFYGSKTCHHCTDFKAKLDSIGIEYTFKDVYAENENNDSEMLDKIQKAGIKGYIELPVLDIEGHIMVRPELSSVLEQVD